MLYLAVETMVAMRAGAFVCAIAVLACAAIHAWFRIAFVDVMLAVVACKASQAQAAERIDAIHASATVKAGTVSNRAKKKKLVNLA